MLAKRTHGILVKCIKTASTALKYYKRNVFIVLQRNNTIACHHSITTRRFRSHYSKCLHLQRRYFCATNSPDHELANPSDKHEAKKQNFVHHIMVKNKKWCCEHGLDQFSNGLTEYSFLHKQTPLATVLSCCDSRVPIAALGFEGPNEIFSVRNIGNQFGNSVGSFRYGLQQLETPFAIIVGHTNCGAIRSAASDYRSLHTMVQQEVIGLVRVIRFSDSLRNRMQLEEMPFDHRCNVYAEINVDYQISRLLDAFEIAEKVEAGTLQLIGMMFDIHNVYGLGYGRLHVVNINGDRDILSLRQHPLLKGVKEIVNETQSNDVANDEIVKRLFSYSSTAEFGFREYA